MEDVDIDQFNRQKRMALSIITDPHDGPVNRFVMVARAIELARKGELGPVRVDRVPSDPVANALDQALEDGEFPGSGA